MKPIPLIFNHLKFTSNVFKMSLLGFQQGVDVEQWLHEPSQSDFRELGFLGAFYESILDFFKILVKAVKTPQAPKTFSSAEVTSRYSRQLQRFFLWGDGCSASEGSLDEALSKTMDLRMNVLSLMLSLSRVLSKDFWHLVDRDGCSLEKRENIWNIKRMEEQAETMLKGMRPFDVEEDPGETESLPDSELSELDHETILDDIITYVDCLTDLYQALENPAVDFPGETDIEQPASEEFTVSSAQALNYCRKIRDQHPSLPKYLVERLGELNAVRLSRLMSLEIMEGDVEPSDLQPLATNMMEMNKTVHTEISEVTEDLLSENQHQLTDTTKSTFQSGSIFDSESNRLGPGQQLRNQILKRRPPHRLAQTGDDTASIATFASYNTTASSIASGRPRVPPMPDEGAEGGTFTCPSCCKRIKRFTSRTQWK